MFTAKRGIGLGLGLLLSIGLPGAAHAGRDRTVEVERGITLTAPEGWVPVTDGYRNAVSLIAVVDADQARVVVTTEHRRDHDEAVRRLGEIANNRKHARAGFEVIGGWPALVRFFRAPLETADGDDSKDDGNDADSSEPARRVSVVIAADSVLVRIEGTVFPGMADRFVDEVAAMGRSITLAATGDAAAARREIHEMKKDTRVDRPPFGPIVLERDRPRPPGPEATTPLVKLGGNSGELEVTASKNGQTVVVAGQGGFFTSTDFGNTFPQTGSVPFAWNNGGDPSLALGATGSFYLAYIGFPDGRASAQSKNGCATEMSSSPSGATFTFQSHAAFCPLAGTAVGNFQGNTIFATCFPDQEHIAADGSHKVNGKDQVYSVWRQFTTGAFNTPTLCNSNFQGNPDPSIVCSLDGGANFSAPVVVGSGDFARVTVGGDGFVYVVYRDGDDLMFNKFSSCQSGLLQWPGFPVTVVDDVNDVACPVAGLDRCGSGLTSQTVAVDPNFAQHLEVVTAMNTSGSNEKIYVYDSYDGGQSWSKARRINKNVTGRRFMPWVCAMNEGFFVGWYDRRGASGNQNDATDYFVGVSDDNTVRETFLGPEFKMSTAADPECAAGWPRAPRSTNDSEACSTQPQFAGTCSENKAKRCDFSSNNCVGSCQTGNGLPKYGDYNGFGCANGRIYAAWASATTQNGQAPSGIQIFTAALSPPTLSVTEHVVITNNNGGYSIPAWWVITIDGAARARNVGSGGGVGGAVLSMGTHTVDHGSSHTIPGGYATSFSGDCDANGKVTLAAGDHKACVITATISRASACKVGCVEERDQCMKDANSGAPDHPLPKDCAKALVSCENACK